MSDSHDGMARVDELMQSQWYEKWHQNYYYMRDHTLEGKPWLVRVMIDLLIHNKMIATLLGQDTGRYATEELNVLKTNIQRAINVHERWQAAKSESKHEPFWFLGQSEPTELKSTLFGFISSTLVFTV
jgi:hypothetical protein